jgi:hypothetical protein
MDSPHPTREEWGARQAAGPPGLRAILATAAERRAAEDQRRREAEAARDRAAAERRAGFEAAVRAALVAAGAEWLAEYRAPDRTVFGGTRDDGWFSHKTDRFWALFTPGVIGLHNIEISWEFTPGGEWIPFGLVSVVSPAAHRYVSDLPAAIVAAAEYCPTPF